MEFLNFLGLLVIFLAVVSLVPRVHRRLAAFLVPVVIAILGAAILYFFSHNFRSLDAYMVIGLLVGISVLCIAATALRRRG